MFSAQNLIQGAGFIACALVAHRLFEESVHQFELTCDEVVSNRRPERGGRRFVAARLVGVGEREVSAAAVGEAGEHGHLERGFLLHPLADVVERLARESSESDGLADGDAPKRQIVVIGML